MAVKLRELFDSLNGTFFGGRLPRYRLIRAKNLLGKQGDCDPKRCVIRLARRLKGEELRRTLLHEMLHHGGIRHGKRFLAGLARLEKLGEAWAGKERKQYELALKNPFGAALREFLENAAESPACRSRPWRTLRRLVAAEFHPSGPELERAAPWVGRFWKRECDQRAGTRKLVSAC